MITLAACMTIFASLYLLLAILKPELFP